MKLCSILHSFADEQEHKIREESDGQLCSMPIDSLGDDALDHEVENNKRSSATMILEHSPISAEKGLRSTDATNTHPREQPGCTSTIAQTKSKTNNDISDTECGWFQRNKRQLRPWKQPLEYSSEKGNTTIHFRDLERLDNNRWLNDSLVYFYLLYILAETPNVFLFNSFFYSTLTNTAQGISYEDVRTWTKVDIFNYDYVLVPINENRHWYLAIICNLPALRRNTSAGLYSDPSTMRDRGSPVAKEMTSDT